MSVSLPLFRRLEVHNYGLYPGAEEGEGLIHEFRSGISLIVGTNGLGKTTLLNIIFRCLVGPWNPPNSNSVVSSAKQSEAVWAERKAFFSKRVGDAAANAYAMLKFELGGKTFEVSRSLADISILALSIDGAEVALGVRSDRPASDGAETVYRQAFTAAIGATSFMAAIQILNQLVFVDEHRRALLWDTVSQTAVLRDILIGHVAAGQLRECEGKYLSADSRERNLRWQVNRLANEVGKLKAARASAGPLSERLTVILQQVAADEDRQGDLTKDLDAAEQEVKSARLAHERTLLLQEDARVAVEEVRLTRASRLFATLDETSQYITARLYTDGRCRACGADVSEKLKAHDHLLAEGCCLVCEAKPDAQKADTGSATVAEKSELIEKEFSAKKTTLDNLTQQAEATTATLAAANDRFRELTDELSGISQSLSEAKREARSLQARLPPTEERVSEQEREYEALQTAMVTAARQRREYAEELRNLLVSVREAASQKQALIVDKFSQYASEFLAEDASLSYAPRTEKLGQSGDRFELPRYRLDMTSAAYEGKVARESADDVSESQREFIDLAYRMALVDTSISGPASLVMETPEASLDGVFMFQAGAMLRRYAAGGDRQLIVTSNLTDTGLIKSLMEGVDSVPDRVINLFEVAVPTRAVDRFRDKYRALLDECLPALFVADEE